MENRKTITVYVEKEDGSQRHLLIEDSIQAVQSCIEQYMDCRLMFVNPINHFIMQVENGDIISYHYSSAS